LEAHILHLAVETAATQMKPAYAGYETLIRLSLWLDCEKLLGDAKSAKVPDAPDYPTDE
jgi:hypothetical protein